ncbi:hypothetical protein CPB84DRAFT_1816390 [Gymnopilus junonius]|uniref:DUF221-domain-containing protein n=1 Tax=Gymnopilus junonius TaxID=109634 RepID=A0A9P5NL30_GYMJU|nr:hypothetical protein CPB84DRAFT_1816390 [Gymnopilus junonius]
MGDIQTRPFSKNYSGLINQSVIGLGITVLCVTAQEVFKRRRRGLGSRESWEFGYLYQGRSWARFASPPSPAGWPLSWVKQALEFPEDRLRQLRGLDATVYIRFLRGCFWFSLAQLLTTFPILFPIHLEFSENTISPKSMTRASISSLVVTNKGLSLLWIHVCLLFWITLSWMATLFWIINGAFKLRAASLEDAAKRAAAIAEGREEEDAAYFQHPHPQYAFRDVPSRERDHPTRGLRLRTVMVSNVPQSLRNEKDLQEYFEYYMSRKVEIPSMGLTSSTQPGFFNKTFAFLFNRAKRLPAHIPVNPLLHRHERDRMKRTQKPHPKTVLNRPIIDRVVIARKMTELASLLERREEILVHLETAHIKLANKALLAVKTAMERKAANKPLTESISRAQEIAKKRRSDAEERMEYLIEVLGPFVEEFDAQRPLSTRSKKAVSRMSRHVFKKDRARTQGGEVSDDSENSDTPVNYPPLSSFRNPLALTEEMTIWDALLSLPRTSLDAYQPLVNLSHLFRGKVVPSIDYYTAKLNLLASLITENRAKAVADYDPVSTAFVTFADPADARRACKYLAVHPNNPLACLVTMAPAYQDIDWIRVMKSSYRGEFVKDWVVNIGVWGFTLFWLFPVSFLVGLVSIQNISLFWPSLQRYLERHAWQSEVIQSFIPTLLVALLALLIPLILLLIAKKAHTITTLSSLHDLIMTRYYKFLIVNVLVFFCVGTAALQSFLNIFRSTSGPNLITTIASSFPTAGPFYVGWLIFTTAMHGGFELSLSHSSHSQLPLILYPKTSRQTTPRKRSVGIRPRTFNFYYWLPNHTLVIHVLLLFAVLNPLVLPIGLIHVYAKNYEADGKVLLIRIARYSLDGLILSQAVFLAYMVVLKKTVNVGLSAFLIVFTAIAKLLMTRMLRAQYEMDDVREGEIVCNGCSMRPSDNQDPEAEGLISGPTQNMIRDNHSEANRNIGRLTWRLPAWVNFSYSIMNPQAHRPQHRRPNPFGPHKNHDLTEANPTTKQPLDAGKALTQQPPQEVTSNAIKVTPDGYPWNMPATRTATRPIVKNIDPDSSQATLPVVRHPSPPWDDQGTLDLPYDNPFYSRGIDNVLWLPRNPLGTLDLDDTVDLTVSITVEVPAASTKPLSPRIPFEQLPEVDGTEEINLPLVIAKRVQAKEGDLDQTLRPRKSSVFLRKVSGDSNVNGMPMSMRQRKPSTLGRPRQPSYRSSETSGARPDAHAQADFVAANTSASRISLAPQRSRTQNVSAAQAIYHEVMEEERQALANRLEDEAAEANQSESTTSWLLSWMFKRTN